MKKKNDYEQHKLAWWLLVPMISTLIISVSLSIILPKPLGSLERTVIGALAISGSMFCLLSLCSRILDCLRIGEN